eukprot:3917784-Pyramimonas_sp.AAC.1
MPVGALTADDVSKCNAALFDLMVSGRLVLVDEPEELERRRDQPELKSRTQAASRKELDMITWEDLRSQAPGPGGGGGG